MSDYRCYDCEARKTCSCDIKYASAECIVNMIKHRQKKEREHEHTYENCHNLTCRNKSEYVGYNKAIDELLKKTEVELYSMILRSRSNMDIAVGLSVAIRIMEKVAEGLRKEEKEMDERIEKQEKAEIYREKLKGKKYRHFKGGMYEVIDIAVHSESTELIVVYKSCDNPSLIWARPFNMFMSEVDKKKYPDVKQKMRFELVE